ncbi:MAG: hypothetical protein IJQ34_03320 [Kiritimatiellae bacterium]|nr:hypothetical protein [Kiritimatiellia bacterium]
MMVRLLAQVIARGSDEILPAHIQAERLDIEPLLKSGVAVFKRLDLDGYVCRDCAGYEDCFRVYSEIGKDGKTHVYRLCRDEPEEPDELTLSDVSVYGISLPALFHLVSAAFGCSAPQPIAGVAGAWDFGMSTFAPAKHKRRVFFVRHLAKVPKSAFATYLGCIVIAAGGLRQDNADISLFSFEDVFRYAASGLSIDLDAVSLRFEKRTIENKTERKPNKAMLAKMEKLAKHLKDVAMGFMRALRNGNEDSYAKVVADMKKMEMPSLVKFFNSDEAPCKISKSVLHEYLLGVKYDKKPYAMPARFWFKVCTKIDYLQATTAVCTRHFKRNIEKAASMDADKLFVEIFKLLPSDKR